jgi:hypothetical protein
MRNALSLVELLNCFSPSENLLNILVVKSSSSRISNDLDFRTCFQNYNCRLESFRTHTIQNFPFNFELLYENPTRV